MANRRRDDYTLTKKQTETLAMHERDLSMEAIATALGVSSKIIRKRVVRAVLAGARGRAGGGHIPVGPRSRELMAMTLHYVVDGKSVRATRLNAGFLKAYAIRFGDGPILGYMQRTPIDASEAYVGVVPPDAVGAQLVGTQRTMRSAIAQLMRDATADGESRGNPEVIS
jgi:hypothetical protein